MCHENKMGAAKNSTHIEQYKLSKDSGTAVEQGTAGNSDPSPIQLYSIPDSILYHTKNYYGNYDSLSVCP